MSYYKKLIGEKIYLSPSNADSPELFTQWLNDFETTDYIGRSSKTISLDGERQYLTDHEDREGKFFIVKLSDDKLIGTISLEQIDHLNRTATLGLFVGDKEERSKGYGSEAINLILDFGFNYLNLNNINLDLMEFNERALKCYRKCGFKEYGRRRKCKFIDGKYYDLISMDILSEEFTQSYIKNKNI